MQPVVAWAVGSYVLGLEGTPLLAVTVISALVAMILIDWRLTLIAVFLMPILIFVQRRVGGRWERA